LYYSHGEEKARGKRKKGERESDQSSVSSKQRERRGKRGAESKKKLMADLLISIISRHSSIVSLTWDGRFSRGISFSVPSSWYFPG